MISEFKIRNFKSLESVDLKLGHFNLFVGANASGKSNFLDALRFLQGVSNGFTVGEILNGKPPSATGLKWSGIRGGAEFVSFRRPDGARSATTNLDVTFSGEDIFKALGNDLTYSLAFSTGAEDSHFTEESFSSGNSVLIPAYYQSSSKSETPILSPSLIDAIGQRVKVAARFESFFDIDKDSAQFWGPGHALGCAVYVSSSLGDMQFLDPVPRALKGYASKVERLGESGEGFAALIHQIESDGSKPALLEWLKELRPDEVDDIYALEGLNNDFMVAIKEGNKEFRAPVLSDGTLRFIALAAAFFQPSMPKVLVIEEIEKGLHPSRLRLLLELMRSQSKRTGTQVFATTHSPTLLNWLTEEDRKTTFVCTRDAESGATKMRSLSDVPNLEDLIKKNYNLDQLFEEGWLESVLHES
jgi:AAA15 family ATPase/GTPase